MTHREAIERLEMVGGYSRITTSKWFAIGKIPLIFIPDVAHRIGCKPSDLSRFFARPLINLTNNSMGE